MLGVSWRSIWSPPAHAPCSQSAAIRIRRTRRAARSRLGHRSRRLALSGIGARDSASRRCRRQHGRALLQNRRCGSRLRCRCRRLLHRQRMRGAVPSTSLHRDGHARSRRGRHGHPRNGIPPRGRLDGRRGPLHASGSRHQATPTKPLRNIVDNVLVQGASRKQPVDRRLDSMQKVTPRIRARTAA